MKHIFISAVDANQHQEHNIALHCLQLGKLFRRTNDHTLRQYGENRIMNDLIRSKI